MDRRNGGDPQAPPPRPPKSIPTVHRPRAPEPLMMSGNLPHLSPKPNHLTLSSSNNNINSNINNNNNINNSTATTTTTTSRSNSSNPISLPPRSVLPVDNNVNINNNNHTALTTTSTTSLRHQLPPPLPLAPISSRSPVVNRSIKPVVQVQQQQQPQPQPQLPLQLQPIQVISSPNSSSSTSAISSPVTFARRRPLVTSSQTPVTLITSTVPTLSSNLTNLTNIISSNNNNNNSTLEPIPSSPVTLAQPRPENERLGNEYVDTPFNRPAVVGGAFTTHHQRLQSPHQNSQLNASSTVVSSHHHPHPAGIRNNATPPHTTQHHHHHHLHHGSGVGISSESIAIVSESKLLPPPPRTGVVVVGSTATGTTTPIAIRPTTLPAVITKQPVSFASSKDSSTTALADEVDFVHSVTTDSSPASILCPQCNRCRCGECQIPRQLPSTWLCDKTCLCSAETAIDYVSCLCCVKALFYHCSKDHELEHESDTITCADDPCSCGPHRFTSRWGWMAALSFVLPCLHCYWPMRGCVAICAKCYAHHARPGCRCPTSSSASSAAQQHNNSTKTGRSISNILNRNQANQATNNSHSHTASTQLHDLAPEKRLLDSTPDY